MSSLFLIDANSLIHRAFHALPPLTGPGRRPAGALYGLSSTLLKVIKEERPDFIAAFFDRPEPTFREEVFLKYKAQRPKAPDELISQIVEARNLFAAFGIPVFEAPGFEADDLIGTCTERFRAVPGLTIKILTGDLDMTQLVDGGKVVVCTAQKGTGGVAYYNEDAVKEKFGVLPHQLPEYKALAGDASDNIPGVSGVGPKTAAALIQKYGSVEKIISSKNGGGAAEKVRAQKEMVRAFQVVASIIKNAPLAVNSIEDLRYDEAPLAKVVAYFNNFGFKSLATRAEKENGKTEARHQEGAAKQKTLL